MRRIIIGLSFVALTLTWQGLVTASPVTVHLRMRGGTSDAAYYKDVVTTFNARNEDIKIALDWGPSSEEDFVEKTILDTIAGTGDIVWMNSNWMKYLAASGMFLPLNTYLDRSGLTAADFVPGGLSEAAIEGKIYGVPRNAKPGEEAGLFYNIDQFNQAGLSPPSDWSYDDLKLAAQKLTSDTNGDGVNEHIGLAVSSPPRIWFPVLNLVHANGGALLADVGRHLSMQESFINSVQWYADLINVQHYAAYKNASFATGAAAMWFTGPWNSANLRRQDVGFQWSVALPPRGQVKRAAYGLGFAWYAILASTHHPAEAWKVVQYLESIEAQTKWNRLGGLPATLLKVATASEFMKDPIYATWIKMFDYATPLEIPANYGIKAFNDALWASTASIWTGKASARAAFESAEGQIDAVLAKPMTAASAKP